MNAKIIFIALIALVIPFMKSNSATGKKINYQSYYNERYDYTVAYPTFLTPQREADNGDGRKFIAKDGINQMWIYHCSKMNIETGDTPTIEEAFNEDLQNKNVTLKRLDDDYYIISGQLGKKLFTQYTFWVNDNYFTIWFEYAPKDEILFEDIIKYVIGSFNVSSNETYETNTDKIYQNYFPDFIERFLNACYWGKNFNALLRNNSPELKPYIDNKMDIRRYYNPGAVAFLYNRKNNFGFDSSTDFKTKEFTEAKILILTMTKESPCEFDYKEDQGIYYQVVNKVPDTVNTKTFESVPIKLPYQNEVIMKVHIVGGHQGLRTLYFISSDGVDWKLAFVDDSECSA